jgi:MFS family permease
MRSNFRHLYADIFWYGVLAGSTVAYLSIYATRLGASGFQISLLTAAPAVVNLLFSLPAGRWLENLPLARVSFRSAALHRLGYLVLIPLPWLFPEQGQIRAIVFVTFLMSIPGTLLAISFNALLAEVVPPDWRAEVVGRRNALLAISMTGATLLCGQLLDNFIFPLNYQVVFCIGLVGAIVSTYHLSRLHISKWAEASDDKPSAIRLARVKGRGFRDAWRWLVSWLSPVRQDRKPLLRLELLRGTMGKFMFSYLVFYTFQYIPLPIFPLAYVRLLNLTDGQIGLGSALFYGTMMLASLQLSRMSNRWGHHRLLAFSALCFGQYPLLLGLAQGARLYWVACFVGGVIYAILSASLINRLMEVVPEDQRPPFMALHNLVLNLGILFGSLTAPALSGWFGLQHMLLLGAGLRFVAGLLLLWWG